MCPSQILLRVARRQRWWWSWFSRNLREEAQPWHSEDYRSNHPTETPLQFTWKRQNLRQETRKLSFEIPLLPQGIFWNNKKMTIDYTIKRSVMMIQDQEDYHPPWPQIDQDKLDLVLDFFAIFLSVVNFQWGDREGWNQEWRESVALTFRSVSLWSWRLSSDPTDPTDCGFGVGGGYGDGGDENMQPWHSGVSHSHHDDSLLILHRTQDWTKRCTVVLQSF